MARFGAKTMKGSLLKSAVLPAAAILLTLWLLFVGVRSMTGAQNTEQLAAAQRAITRAAVQCYAFEGEYPPGIDYLKKHYGLMVDEEKYAIDYQCFASNIMPNITVIEKTNA